MMDEEKETCVVLQDTLKEKINHFTEKGNVDEYISTFEQFEMISYHGMEWTSRMYAMYLLCLFRANDVAQACQACL